MLHELRIENLLLIDRAELCLNGALNVVTGETGTGKTILAHSLDLLMGGRARPHIVRPGASQAYVEGVFELPEDLLAASELSELAERIDAGDGEIVLARRVSASGRTSAFVQGRSASAADLRALGGRLLSFYGQHEHRRLTLASAQLQILDGFAGAEHLARCHRYSQAHRRVLALATELDELKACAGRGERELDLLRYELDEIEAVAPSPDELDDLRQEREVLRHADQLRAAVSEAVRQLDQEGVGGRAAVAAAAAQLAEVSGVAERLDRLEERVRSLALELDDVSGELLRYLDSVHDEPGRLQAVEERLETLERLMRKHGGSIESVNAHAARCRAELERLAESGEQTEALENALGTALAERGTLAAKLSQSRRRAAQALRRELAGELDALGLPDAVLEVALLPYPDGFGAEGAERIEFAISTNPGVEPSPLRDAASGGELSRLMLALSILAGEGGRGTLAFDEIDAGVGGLTARAIAAKLRRLAERRQVICITHLPAVAAAASRHFRIEKSSGSGLAVASVERVEGEDQVSELCRMLGAESGDLAANRHARELLAA